MVTHRVITEDPPNAGVSLDALDGEPLTQDQMYVPSNLPLPTSPPPGFELVVPGREPRMFSTEHLESFPRVTRDIVLECAGNGRALMAPVPEGTRWALDGVSAITVSGYLLNEVLGPLPAEIVEVVFTGADVGHVDDGPRVPYQFSISRELAESSVPILATHIGGEPLTLLHGAPIRLIVPGHYGMKSVKWVTKVEATDTPFQGHFVRRYSFYGDPEQEDGDPVGKIEVRSLIASPIEGETVPAGALEVRGSAWAGGSEISTVEVSTDDGETWHEADLVKAGEPWAPVRWASTIDADPGTLTVMARATDVDGATQPLQSRWNANGFANNVVHRVTVDVDG